MLVTDVDDQMATFPDVRLFISLLPSVSHSLDENKCAFVVLSVAISAARAGSGIFGRTCAGHFGRMCCAWVQ